MRILKQYIPTGTRHKLQGMLQAKELSSHRHCGRPYTGITPSRRRSIVAVLRHRFDESVREWINYMAYTK